MKILVPNSGAYSGLDIKLTDGTITKDISDMLQFPQSTFLFNDLLQFPIYDDTVDYEVGTVVYHANSANYKALEAKSDTTDYWIDWSNKRYTILNEKAELFVEGKYYTEQTYVFTEIIGTNDYTYYIYMTPSDGVFTIADLQELYGIVRPTKFVGSNIQISVTSRGMYLLADTIKKGFIFDVQMVIKDTATNITTETPIVPFKALVDYPKTTPLAGNVLEWEQLPYYGQLAMFDKYMNTKYTLPTYMGFHYTFEDSTIEAIAVLGVSGDTAQIDWTNTTTNIHKEIKLKERVVTSFYEYFFSKFNQKSIIYSSKEVTNIDSVSIQIDGKKVGASAIIVGKEYDIGNTQYGYQKRSRDFSKKSTTKSGYDFLTAGKKANTYIVKITIDNDKADEIFDLLQSLSTTLTLYLLEDGSWVYGWYKDLYMTKSNPVKSEYNLEINGVI